MKNMLIRALRVLARKVKKYSRLRSYRGLNMEYVEPNFLFFPELFSSDPIAIDAGCGYEADFSQFMIDSYGAKSYAIDPTEKHKKYLKAIEEKRDGKFIYIPAALSHHTGSLTFFESKSRESGSLKEDHGNVRNGDVDSYIIVSFDINGLLKKIGTDRVDILKIDIEGAEYELFSEIDVEQLKCTKQLFVEFHHHTLSSVSEADTARIVTKICESGFKSYSLDDHNYLFVRSE